LLSEALSWNEPLGALIVIAGIAVSQGRLKGLRRRGPGSFPTWWSVFLGVARDRRAVAAVSAWWRQCADQAQCVGDGGVAGG